MAQADGKFIGEVVPRKFGEHARFFPRDKNKWVSHYRPSNGDEGVLIAVSYDHDDDMQTWTCFRCRYRTEPVPPEDKELGGYGFVYMLFDTSSKALIIKEKTQTRSWSNMAKHFLREMERFGMWEFPLDNKDSVK